MTPEQQANYRAVRPVKCCREYENLAVQHRSFSDTTRWVEHCKVCGRDHHVIEAEPEHVGLAAVGI